MATASPAAFGPAGRSHTLNVMRMLVTGGATAAIVFVLCWAGTFIPFSSPTHAYIGLFTLADVNSVQAVVEGTLWSLLFGAMTAALFTLIYNATARLGHPREQEP